MLQQNHGGGLDPSTARFSTQFAAGQSGGGGFPLAGGNVPGLHNMQGSYGLQNTLPGARANMPLPNNASQQSLQGRFAGGNPVAMQQLQQQYAQGPGRGMPGHPGLALNGLNAAGGPARGNVGGGVGGMPGGVRPAGNPAAGANVGLGGLGTANASNLAALQQRGGTAGGGMPGGVNLGGFAANAARLGVGMGSGLGGIGGGLGMQGQQPRNNLGNQPAEFSIQTEDFPPISGAVRPPQQQEQQQQGQPGNLASRLGQQAQQLRGQQAAPAPPQQGFAQLGRGMAGGPGSLSELHPNLAAELSRGGQAPYAELAAGAGAGVDFQQQLQAGGGAAGGIPQGYEQMIRYQAQQNQLRQAAQAGGLPVNKQQQAQQQAAAQQAQQQQQAAAQQQQAGGPLAAAAAAAAVQQQGKAAGGQQGGADARQGGAPPDRFGLLGLLGVIRMTDPDLTTLALGTDLTTLGLNLNSPDNLYKTFASPWADGPQKLEPDFKVPSCYLHSPPRLQPGYFGKFAQETLLYIFYSMPGDEAQLLAADELASRGWWYHKDWKVWLTRMPNVEPLVKGDSRYERGSYMVFNTSTWEFERKDNLTVVYDMLERPPNLLRPAPQQQAGAAGGPGVPAPPGPAPPGAPLPAK